jgi:metal-responsive CopG/Arc/MetJ family transcriptional regulator
MAATRAEDPKVWEPVSFREDQRILKIMDRVAQSKGTDRSAVYREAARFFLASNSHLTSDEKKDLGVATE